MLNKKGKLLPSFAKGNNLVLLNTLFSTPKSGVSYIFPSDNRSKGQARLNYILTKQADRRLARCVNVRRPPLEAPESDHNLVYSNVRILRRSAPNRRKRDSAKEAPKTSDLRRLVIYPNLQCQVTVDNADLPSEVTRRIRNEWCSFRKYTLELCDRPSAPLELKIRMLRTEVLETMLYDCVMWSPRVCHYDTLRRAHHRFLARCIGW